MPFSTEPNQIIELSQEVLLWRVTQRIRRSLTLQEVLNATVAEIQAFLGVDRVKIYQFHADESGQVVAEHLGLSHKLPSLYGLNFPADDIPQAIRQLFIEARMRTVVDVATRQIGQSRLRDPQTGEILVHDWAFRPLDDCHAEYLTTMGVRSSLVAPILHQDQLWGLLVAHHTEPKYLSERQMHAVQTVVDQLSIAIAQSNLLTQAQEKADREATVNRIGTLLYSFPTIELQTALEQTVDAFHGVGGQLLIQPEVSGSSAPVISNLSQVFTYGMQPGAPQNLETPLIELCAVIQQHFQASDDRVWAIDDIDQPRELQGLQPLFQLSSIRSLLVIPLQARQQVIGYLTVFRNQRDTEVLWAGQFDPDMRQLYPRQSFELWRQTKTGQTHPWTANDLELAKALGGQFAAAIEQYRLYQQLRTFNANLEKQVQERTGELQQANQQLNQTLQELKQAQTQLIQTEKMSSLGQLVAGIAHEINNPINFIHGNLVYVSEYTQHLLHLIQLYQRDCEPSQAIQAETETFDLNFLAEDLPKILNSMQVGTSRIRQIVLSLRNFSRLDQADLKQVDLHEGIDSTLMILQHRLKGKSSSPIKLIKQYGDLPLVECYAGAMNQVFMNLLGNAIDSLEDWNAQRSIEAILASPAQICIITKREADHIWIRIADNGLGMTEAARRHLFNPFFTTKPVGKGTGLGLSISYQIVTRQHNGELTCTSTPNQGAEFTIKLPIR